MITRRNVVLSGAASAAVFASGNAQAFWPLFVRIVLGGVGRRTAFTVAGTAARTAGTRSAAAVGATTYSRRARANSFSRSAAEEFTVQAMGDVFDARDARSSQVMLEVNNPNNHTATVEPINVCDRNLSTGAQTVSAFRRIQVQPGLNQVTLDTGDALDVGTYERTAWFPDGTSADVSYSPLYVAVEGRGYQPRVSPRVRCPIYIPRGTRPHWEGQSLCDAAIQDSNRIRAYGAPPRRTNTLDMVGDFIIAAGVIHWLTR
jgi:hypothetical protein